VEELDAETLNARLLGGHRLLVTRGPGQGIVSCTVEFFDERVPVALFNTYLANGMITVPQDGVGFAISTEGKKRLAAMSRGRR
jgi:hypothetical protein